MRKALMVYPITEAWLTRVSRFVAIMRRNSLGSLCCKGAA